MVEKQNGFAAYIDAPAGRRDQDHGFVRAGADDADYFVREIRRFLKEARRQRRISATDLAGRLRVSQPTVSAIESGQGNLGLRTMARYLVALDIDLDRVKAALRFALSEGGANDYRANVSGDDSPEASWYYEEIGRRVVRDLQDVAGLRPPNVPPGEGMAEEIDRL